MFVQDKDFRNWFKRNAKQCSPKFTSCPALDGHRKGPVGFLSTTILDPIALCKWAKLWGFLALHSIMLQRLSASQSLTAANSTQWNSTYPQWLTNTVTRSDQSAVLEQRAVRSGGQAEFLHLGFFYVSWMIRSHVGSGEFSSEWTQEDAFHLPTFCVSSRCTTTFWCSVVLKCNNLKQ